MITFVTGGGRSGKSSFAENKASTYNKKIYLATALAFDDEMKYRIKEHQYTRDDSWVTVEGYKNIAKSLEEKVEGKNVILLDCLTNLVSNMMIMNQELDWDTLIDSEVSKIEMSIKNEITEILDFVRNFSIDLIVVSNEVGMGLVPEYPLGRRFRDIAGRMNQFVASKSDEAFFIVSGLPIKLK